MVRSAIESSGTFCTIKFVLLKAIEMSKSTATTIGAKEMDAYKSQPYQELCEAIGLATEEAESLRWQLEAAKMRFELFRTQEASNRNIDRMTR